MEPTVDGGTDSTSSRRRFPRWSPYALAALVVVGVAIVAVLIVADDGSGGYDDAVRQRFLEACTADGGAPVRSTCECVYEGVEGEIPFERFEEIDEDLAAQAAERSAGAPLELPPDVQAIVDGCVEQAGAGPESS